jgi:hypothetical protein
MSVLSGELKRLAKAPAPVPKTKGGSPAGLINETIGEIE